MKSSITAEQKEEPLTKPIEKVETEETPKIKSEAETITIKPINTPKPDIKQGGGFGNTVKKAFKAVVDFSNRHPVLTGIVKAVGVAGLAAAAIPKGTIIVMDEWSLSEREIVSQTIDDNWEEKEWEGEKPYTTCPACGKPISHQNDGGNGFCIDCAWEH